MATLDIEASYVLTNSYTGERKLLGVDATVPQMLAKPNNDGNPPDNAQWFLTSTDIAPFYRLHTRQRGAALALDVVNDAGATGSTALRLADTGRYSGQYWRFDVWSAGGSPYAYRLSNNFTGPGMHLDVYSDTLLPHLAGGDATGQHWKVEVVRTDAAAGGSSAPTASTSASVSTASGGASSSQTTIAVTDGGGSTGGGESALSTGAIVGIAVGGVAAVAMLVGVIAFILLSSARRRKRSQAGNGVAEQPVADVKTQLPIYDDASGHVQPSTYGQPVNGPVELATGWHQPPAELASTQTEFPVRPYR